MDDPIRVLVHDEMTKELDDFAMPLKKLRKIIDNLIDKHGDELMIRCDGGHNNVQFELYNEITRSEVQKIIKLRREWAEENRPKKRRKADLKIGR